MRRKDVVMLVFVGIFFTLIGGVMFWVHHLKNDPTHMMNSVVEPLVRDVVSSKWSGEVLMKHATPEFQVWLVQHNLGTGMPGFTYLGKVKRFVGIKKIDMNENKDFTTLTASFEFEAAPADMILQLAKRDGQWLIYSFGVQSTLFHNAGTAQ